MGPCPVASIECSKMRIQNRDYENFIGLVNSHYDNANNQTESDYGFLCCLQATVPTEKFLWKIIGGISPMHCTAPRFDF